MFIINLLRNMFILFILFIIMALDPIVWGPHYWFVLHTIALTYPFNPNETIKKKYYDFVHNIPLFLPISIIGNKFSTLLDKYPVSPYLDSQKSFVKWMHFIHNKINISLSKPEVSMEETMVQYYEHYKPKAIKEKEHRKRREKYVFMGIVILIISLTLYLYKK